jgi:hypothetical protein
MTVTKVEQATYLKKAYAYAGRYSQVKNLFWFLVKDAHSVGNPPDWGVYTGLRETDATRKLSWFAFAGGNRLTIEAPRSARYGAVVHVTGKLSNAALGTLANRTLVLESRRPSGGAWRTLKTTRTGSGGNYRFWVKAAGSRVYRVAWRGVRNSATRTVKVY